MPRPSEKRIAIWSTLELDELARTNPIVCRARDLFITGQLGLFDALSHCVQEMDAERTHILDRATKAHWSHIPPGVMKKSTDG